MFSRFISLFYRLSALVKMSTRACFVILTLCYIILSFAFNDRHKVRHLLEEVCPYTNFCHTNARKIVPTEDIPCCLPCSCDDDCLEFDNCCPDKELINGPRPPIVPCRDSYVKPPNGYSAVYTGFYRVIDSCPSSEDISNLNSKCIRENRTSLEDFVWVSDNTGKIYQNTYCAECHGVKESIPWQIETTCYDIMRANFGNLREILLSEKCNIINIPPEYLKTVTDKYTCLNPKKHLYSSCNETGLMDSFDPAVEIACKQSTWPFILDPYLAKNVFCAMCNYDIPTSSSDKFCTYFDIRGHDSGFISLIDHTSVSVDTLKETNNCGFDELFDEFMVSQLTEFPIKSKLK